MSNEHTKFETTRPLCSDADCVIAGAHYHREADDEIPIDLDWAEQRARQATDG